MPRLRQNLNEGSIRFYKGLTIISDILITKFRNPD